MKQKILFLMADLGGGGAEKVLVNLVNALPADKYDITIRTIFGKGVNAKFLAPHIKYSSLLPFRMTGGYVMLQKLISRNMLYKLMVRGKYDIEIAYMMHVPTRALSGSNSSAKKFAWSHTLHISQNAYRSSSEFMATYRGLDGIAFVSRDSLLDFNTSYFVHPYGRVVHNVIDSKSIINKGNESIPIPLNPSVLNLCSVGRLSKEKGYLRLVKSLGELHNEGLKNWHLYLLGEGGERDAIIEIAHKYGVADRVTLLGFQTNPHKYVSKMDLFVCSSETEGYSTAVTESMILGVPVLTTDCSGMNEIIGDSGAGIIVPNSTVSLKAGLRQVLSDNNLLAEMKVKASERSRIFDTQNLIAEFENFINGKA